MIAARSGPPRLVPPLLAAGLTLFALAVFWPAGDGDFTHYDDPLYVTGNRQVLAGLTGEGVRWAFRALHAGNWHPLTWLSHMLDAEIFGAAPRGHHLTSVALHAANGALLFLVLRGMTGAVWRSALAAAVFVVHPLRVESVAWVAERKDVLSACLWLVTVGCYLGYLRSPGFRRYGALVAVYAFGLMAKPMLVTLPLVLLILDWWPLGRLATAGGTIGTGWLAVRRRLAGLLREKAPLLLLAAASAAVTWVAQSQSGAISTLDRLPPGPRVANAFVAAAGYLLKTVWPRDLSVFYPYPPAGALFWQAGLSAAILATATYAVLRSARNLPFLAAGWLWYLTTLLPVIGLVQVGDQAMADRYTYLPLVGIVVALCWGGERLSTAPRWLTPAVSLAALLLLAALAGTTRKQLGVWRNDAALFGHAVRSTPRSWLAWYNLGNERMAAARWPEAAEAFRQATQVRPDYADAHNNLCAAALQLERYREAESACRLAVGLNPTMTEGFYNLGLALSRQRRHREAFASFQRSLDLDPGSIAARLSLEETRRELRTE